MKTNSKGKPLRFDSGSEKDDCLVGRLWDEREQLRIDELSSDPVLDRLPSRKSQDKLTRLLKSLDTLKQGGSQ